MSHEERSPKGEHRSAPVLALPLSVGCYDGTTIMDANGKQVAVSDYITFAAAIVAAVNESMSLRAERDAALAEVARLKNVIASTRESLFYAHGGATRGESCHLDGGECALCSMRDCPEMDPLHYHHDGCPVCADVDVQP